MAVESRMIYTPYVEPQRKENTTMINLKELIVNSFRAVKELPANLKKIEHPREWYMK